MSRIIARMLPAPAQPQCGVAIVSPPTDQPSIRAAIAAPPEAARPKRPWSAACGIAAMAEQQTLADPFYGGSDSEAYDTIGPRAPVLSDEEVAAALFRPSDAGDRSIVERLLSPYLLSTRCAAANCVPLTVVSNCTKFNSTRSPHRIGGGLS
jgi:hypothetical protein